jgi:hypothetical protein
VKYGRIEGWGGSLGAGYDLGPAERRGYEASVLTGPLAAVELTEGTVAGHLGFGWLVMPFAGITLRAVYLHAWHTPRIIRAGENYGGVEAKLMFLGFNVFVGGYRHVRSGPGPDWAGDAGIGFIF